MGMASCQFAATHRCTMGTVVPHMGGGREGGRQNNRARRRRRGGWEGFGWLCCVYWTDPARSPDGWGLHNKRLETMGDYLQFKERTRLHYDLAFDTGACTQRTLNPPPPPSHAGSQCFIEPAWIIKMLGRWLVDELKNKTRVDKTPSYSEYSKTDVWISRSNRKFVIFLKNKKVFRVFAVFLCRASSGF